MLDNQSELELFEYIDECGSIDIGDFSVRSQGRVFGYINYESISFHVYYKQEFVGVIGLNKTPTDVTKDYEIEFTYDIFPKDYNTFSEFLYAYKDKVEEEEKEELLRQGKQKQSELERKERLKNYLQ